MAFNTDPTSAKDDAPTNVKFQETSSVTDGHFISVIVMADDSLSTSMTIGSELSNETTTKGFRIKSESTLTFNNFDTVDYFVLIHSDDDKKHHFAKVTNLIVEDNGNGTSTCDAFEFEPKLGNEIPKGTKYRIITGINDTNNKIVALSVGLKQDASSANLKDNLVCARPLFYFFNERLDKKNELDHNTKYYALGKTGSSTTVTIAQHASDGITFRTVSDFGKRIIDYSKYSLVVNMTDKLRTLDIGAGGNTTSNEGGTVSLDYNVYKDSYINARRSSDNSITTRDTLGQTRYLHYSHSPEKSNLATAVIENETRDSINQGSFSESRIVDNGRIMNKKINVFDPYKVRNLLHRANLDAFVDLKASFVSEASANTFNIRTEYDLGTVLNVGDEVKIQDKIMLVASIGSFTNPATLQTLTVRAEKRTENAQSFTSLSFTPTADDILSRRAYNPTDNTIITTMNLINRTDNLEIVFNSTNENKLLATISAVDKDKSMMTVSYTGDSYYANPLEFIRGEYTVYSLKFEGEVEQINTVKEESQTFLDIKGRNKLNKLLSPIINKDTAFSEDIIYSTNSPTNTLGDIKSGNTYSIALGATQIDTNITTGSSNFDNYPDVGSKLFSEKGYIGEVLSHSTHGSSKLRLVISPSLITTNSEALLMATEKNYVFTKALGSSNFASSSPTSLTGSAGKGLIFTAGNTIDSSGAEVSALTNTSSNSHEKAIGYEINSPKNIKSDSSFECLLKDEIGAGTKSTFDTVNTLIDFEVVSTSKKDNVTQIELAPYIPITLGRQIEYEGKKQDRIEQTMLLACTVTTGQNARVPLIVSTNQATDFSKVKVGEPLFLSRSGSSFDESFIGYVLDIEILEQKQDHITTGDPASNTTTAKILVDRTHTSSNLEIDLDVGDEIYVSQRAGNHLNLINSSHLWGGKMVSIPHQKTSTSGLVPFNAYRSSTTDFTSVFGSPYYKIINADLFRIGNEKFTYKQNFSGFDFDYSGRYAGRKSEANINFTAYKFKPRITSTDLTVVKSAQEGSNEELAYDTRGNKGIYGSRLTSSRRFDRANRLSQISHDFRFTSSDQVQHHEFQNDDESFNRLFMYVVSDLLPYSSLRTDSLFHVDGSGVATKSLGEYKLFLLENKKKTDDTNNLNIQDENYQSLSFTTDKDITELKQLGLMRLTECVYDEYFNLINPEKSTEEIYFNNPLHFGGNIFTRTISDESGTALFVKEINATTIKFCDSGGTLNNVSLITGDEIFIGDKYVCTIDGTSTGNTHNILTSRGSFTPNMDNTTVRAAFRLTDTRSIGIGGRKKTNSIFGTSPSSSVADGGYHPLKGAIIPKTSNYNYGEASGDTARVDNSGTAFSLLTDSEVVLPSIFTGNGFLTHTNFDNQEGATSHVIAKMSRNTVGISYANRNPHGGTIGVILDTYNIESDTNLLKVGDNTDVLGSQGDQRGGLSLDPTGSEPAREIVTVTSVNHYKQLLSPTQSSSSHDYSADADRKSPADGAYLGFKLRLFSTSWTNTSISSSNGTLYLNNISLNGANTILNSWLELVDLTGCYLVPEADSGTQTANAVGGVNLGQGRHADPIYVYSHEPQTLESSVNIITSASLVNNRAYRIMQPNQVCLYDFHPNEIHLNTLRPEYTKKANSNAVYKVTDNNYFFYEGNKPHFSSNEAVLSMFVAIDLDNRSGGGNIIVPKANTNTLLPNDTYSMFLSDGDTSLKSSVSSTITVDEKHAISFSNIKKLKGIVSISETFVVDSLEELKISPNRACIGSTVTIANEAEELLNELFEEEGLTFDNTTPTYPLFIAPKFIGNSLFSAINYILERKDLSLIINENSFSVKSRDDVIFRTNILVNDDKMVDYETVDSGFDFYNQVIVYGSSHKADRKNLSSIQKVGRKTLEEVDSSLITQQDVDERASRLLKIHGTLDKKIKVRVIPTGHEQLRAGDIIQFESKQENVPLDNYIVLDITHPISGFITIEMGKYSKKLEDVFAELLLQSQSNSNTLRALSYNEKSSSVDFLERVNLKEMSLLIRTRASTGSFHLGFAATLNTNTNTFGFAGGTITLTNLLEEDLL
tara:strand:+ start:3536 stop:9721 length:6186 start_codon:yes stop_codon:yes gene_type:complete